jgi:hypothetical protein
MPRMKTTRQGEWIPREALPPDAIVHLDHAGEWVAWDHEMKRAAAIAAGVARPVCESPTSQPRPQSSVDYRPLPTIPDNCHNRMTSCGRRAIRIEAGRGR